MNEFEKLIYEYSEKNRLEILAALDENDQGMTYSELKDKLNFSPNAFRYNLRILIDAGLVEVHSLKGESLIFKITEKGRDYLKKNIER
jgi:DNA-binding transcriptional ArsR family regulator